MTFVIQSTTNPDQFLGRTSLDEQRLSWGPLAFAYTFDSEEQAARAWPQHTPAGLDVGDARIVTLAAAREPAPDAHLEAAYEERHELE